MIGNQVARRQRLFAVNNACVSWRNVCTLTGGLTLASLSLIAPSARAGVTFYTSETDYASHAPASTLITFNDVAAANYFVSYGMGGSHAFSGVTFEANNNLTVVDAEYVGLYSYDGDGLIGAFASTATDPADMITAQLPDGIFAVATNYSSLLGKLGKLTATLDNGAVVQYDLPDSPEIGVDSFGFVGFISSSPIVSVSFSAQTANEKDILLLDNFQFGPHVSEISAIPEPGSVAFGILSVASVTGLILRKRRKQHA